MMFNGNLTDPFEVSTGEVQGFADYITLLESAIPIGWADKYSRSSKDLGLIIRMI